MFVYGFRKNEKDNLSDVELRYFKKLANDFLVLNVEELNQLITQKMLFDLEEMK
ncbi:MAG: type II toxin-antitoxin system RelE/ParE family toxin [Thiomargarita sp.]|nr:type II toxin-antitoxin system RelE/ParE family toxin [Thiomargarita sp.]